MRSIFILLFTFIITAVHAQLHDVYNGGFEAWRGGYFLHDTTHPHGVQCCGLALAVPTEWTIPELIMQMPNNTFIYKEKDTAFIHSGNFSVRMYTNTTTIDSAGDLFGYANPLIPGNVTCAGIVCYGDAGIKGDPYQTILYSRGEPFADTPTALNFYMKFYHESADTALYAYVLTRWDSLAQREDTLAFHQADIATLPLPQNEWMLFSDTIQYLHAGMPDTLHLIFYGGRNGDSTRIGNTTWLDDISLYYRGRNSSGATGLVHLSTDDAVTIYPNPANTTLHIRMDEYMTGYTLELYDVRGSKVISEILTASQSTVSTAALSEGVYLYRLLDRSAAAVKSGRVLISK